MTRVKLCAGAICPKRMNGRFLRGSSEHRNAIKAARGERWGKGGEVFMRGEQGQIGRGAGKALALGEMGDAPGDALGAIDEAHAGAKGGGELRGEEGEMGAGEDYGVNALAARLAAQAIDGALDQGRVDGLSAQGGFGGGDEFGGAMAQQALVGGEFGFEPVDIGLADGGLCAEQADGAGLGHAGGGFDGRDGADDGHFEHIAHTGQRDGGGGVAGDADEAGFKPLGHAAQHAGDAGGDLGLGLGTIGQACGVGDINDGRFWQEAAQGGQHGQAANAGIKEQDRAGGIGGQEARFLGDGMGSLWGLCVKREEKGFDKAPGRAK